jgi:agmatine deiminase
MKIRDLQYKMPAEWDKHERTLISWPIKDSMCYPENYEEVCKGYEELIHAIAEFEPVTVLVNPVEIETVRSIFNQVNITCIEVEHNDAWLRDNGPTFLTAQGSRVGINWGFNAWGEKYSPWNLDDEVAGKVLKHFEVPKIDAPFILEGGSIHVDGEGTLLTTKECLLNPNRNPHLTKEQIEEQLKNYLDIEKVIWLERGLSGDETDGHIDNIACFAAPGKILLQVCSDEGDENAAITKECIDILQNQVDAKGRKLEIIPIEQPPRRDYNGSRLTLSYLNFYFVNGGIILPVFGGDAGLADEEAIKVLQKTFPDRKIRTIDGNPIVKEGGNVHCTTQQMPQA